MEETGEAIGTTAKNPNPPTGNSAVAGTPRCHASWGAWPDPCDRARTGRRDPVGVRRLWWRASSGPRCRSDAEAETLMPPCASAAMSRYRIVRDDGSSDAIAGRVFDSYDAAYVVLERYYGDLCCSDERETYRIEEASSAENQADGQPG